MKKVTRSFNIIELQTISHCAAILRACTGIQPFKLANNINGCKTAADAAIKNYEEEFELIKERSVEDQKQADKDLVELVKKKFETDYPDLKENEFSNLDINGEKEVQQQNGSITKFNYRDAYFNLLGLVIT